MQGDPIGLDGGLNIYGYAYQSPLMYYDPYGQVSAGTVAVGVLGNTPVGRAARTGWAAGSAADAAITAGLGLPLGVRLFDEINPDSSRTKERAGERQKEYIRMKNNCDKKPKPTGVKCADIARNIAHAENCALWYEAWDKKWLPGRHAEKIQNMWNRANRLKEQYNDECVSGIQICLPQ